jgi:predicted ATP-grasp superfamily ATP-dependent carboligase
VRVFIYEYTCANSDGVSVAPSLQREGWAMLAALLEDFNRVGGVETVTLVSGQAETVAARHGFACVPAHDEETGFRSLAGAADYSLIIAPELDNVLAERCRWVVEAGGRLLGPAADAVDLTGDKLACGRFLLEHGVPTPPSVAAPISGACPPVPFPLIWKPRQGAGSQFTALISEPDQWTSTSCRHEAQGCRWEGIAQAFVPGLPASVAFLIGPASTMPLPPVWQRLSEDNQFHYLGGTLPLPPPLAERAERVARRAVEVVPGLLGYVGVDIVLGDAGDGSLDQVIEINPRPTTSYVGLRAAAKTNLAAALLAVVRGQWMPPLSWRSETIRFDADGGIESDS